MTPGLGQQLTVLELDAVDGMDEDPGANVLSLGWTESLVRLERLHVTVSGSEGVITAHHSMPQQAQSHVLNRDQASQRCWCLCQVC